MVKVGLLVRLEAKPGKEAEVGGFIEGAVALANREASTIAWFAVRLGPSTFGVFDVFPDDLTAPLINQYLQIKARHLL